MIVSASFYWKNDRSDGLGFTLNASSGWTPELLTSTFDGPTVKEYFAASDAQLGSDIVADYLSQLDAIARTKGRGLRIADALIAALNVMWLASRGFIPNDEFNGPLFVQLRA